MRKFSNTAEELAAELEAAYGLIGDMMPIVLRALGSTLEIPFEQQFYFWTSLHTVEETYIDLLNSHGLESDLEQRRDELDGVSIGRSKEESRDDDVLQ